MKTKLKGTLNLLKRIMQLWFGKSEPSQSAPPVVSYFHKIIDPSANTKGMHVRGVPGGKITIGKDAHVMAEVHLYTVAELQIGSRTYIGPGTELHVAKSITIGNDVLISSDCSILDSDMHSEDFELRKNDIYIDLEREGFSAADKNWEIARCRPIVIQDKAWIGLRAIILKGVTIGEGAIVGAGSVVSKDVPPWVVVAGNPARVVKTLQQPGAQ